eukprot:7363414-Prymnesium_polylepis.1
MKEFYLSVKGRWPELPAWDFFRQAISDNSKKKLTGFRIMRLTHEQSRRRLTAASCRAQGQGVLTHTVGQLWDAS